MIYPDCETVLLGGLAWLFRTVQPDNAMVTHHGISFTDDGLRTYGFVVSGKDSLPTITVTAHAAIPSEYRGHISYPECPLADGEVEELAEYLERYGLTLDHHWNGYPAVSGSVSVKNELHPSLFRAHQRYRAGCLIHPETGVFCTCTQWRAGHHALIRPRHLDPKLGPA